MEANAGQMATNVTYTIYVGSKTNAIVASSSAQCGAMKTHATYGNYFECTCALPAYAPPPMVCSGGKMCAYDKLSAG